LNFVRAEAFARDGQSAERTLPERVEENAHGRPVYVDELKSDI
jgi:hypothetical protein